MRAFVNKFQRASFVISCFICLAVFQPWSWSVLRFYAITFNFAEKKVWNQSYKCLQYKVTITSGYINISVLTKFKGTLKIIFEYNVHPENQSNVFWPFSMLFSHASGTLFCRSFNENEGVWVVETLLDLCKVSISQIFTQFDFCVRCNTHVCVIFICLCTVCLLQLED